MQIQNDVHRMSITSEEIADLSRELRRMEDQLEDIQRQLSRQSSLTVPVSKLKQIRDNLQQHSHSLNMMSTVLQGTANLYGRAENRVYEDFDSARPSYNSILTQAINLQGINTQINEILYRR